MKPPSLSLLSFLVGAGGRVLPQVRELAGEHALPELPALVALRHAAAAGGRSAATAAAAAGVLSGQGLRRRSGKERRVVSDNIS